VRVAPSRDDGGFTLIELLIVLVILPIVVGGIAVAMITSLKDQSGLQAKLSDSADSVVASSYYSRDIQSAAEVTTSTNPSGPGACRSAGLPGAVLIASMEWGTGPTVVSYYYWTPASPSTAATELFRVSCQSGGPPTLIVISHSLSKPPTGSSVVTASCVNGAACSSYAGAGGWIPTFDVTDVTIGITDTSGYQFTLVGSPLTGPQVKSPTPLAGSLLLLGDRTDLTYYLGGVFGLPPANVTVNGTVDMNSGPSSVAPAIRFNSQNDSLLSQGANSGVDVLNCNGSGVADGTACTGAWANCSFFCSGNTVTPQPKSISTAVPDPLAAWAQTNQPKPIGNGGGVNCTTRGSNWTCPAGRYSNGLAVPSNANVTFSGPAGSAYQFGVPGCNDCALSFAGGDTVTFGSGVYSFYGGLRVDGSGRSGANTLTSASGGVLFYVADGTTDFAYNDASNKVTLAAMGTGTYAGLLFWQDGSDPNNQISIAGYSQSPNTYQGQIYAPNDELDFFGFGNNVTTGPICASSMVIGGSQANIVVG